MREEDDGSLKFEDEIFERLRDVYSNTQDQIKFADAKAGGLIALSTIVVGFVFNKLGEILAQDLSCLSILLATLFFTFVSVGVFFCFSVIFSRFGDKEQMQTLVFFAHISKAYSKKDGEYLEAVLGASKYTWVEQLSSQIVSISDIATLKHQKVRKGVLFLVGAFFTALMLSLNSLVLQVFRNSA